MARVCWHSSSRCRYFVYELSEFYGEMVLKPTADWPMSLSFIQYRLMWEGGRKELQFLKFIVWIFFFKEVFIQTIDLWFFDVDAIASCSCLRILIELTLLIDLSEGSYSYSESEGPYFCNVREDFIALICKLWWVNLNPMFWKLLFIFFFHIRSRLLNFPWFQWIPWILLQSIFWFVVFVLIHILSQFFFTANFGPRLFEKTNIKIFGRKKKLASILIIDLIKVSSLLKWFLATSTESDIEMPCRLVLDSRQHSFCFLR